MTHQINPREAAIIAHQNIKEKNYWLDNLSGITEKSYLPYDMQEKEETPKIEEVKISFPGPLCSAIIQLSNRSDARLHMILTTALVVLVNKYTGDPDCILGTPIYKPDAEGQFVNLVLPLKNRLEQHMTFKDLLLRVRETIIKANENRNYPIEILTEQLNMDFSPVDDFPLLDIAILLENIQYKEYLQHIKINLVFSFLRTGESLEGRIEYNVLKYKKETIERIARHFTHLFTKVLSSIDLKIKDIDLLSEQEKAQLLFEFNDTDQAYPVSKPLHQVFEEVVNKNPAAAAVIRGEKTITYRVLNEKSRQMAGLLRKKGIGPHAIAAIMMDNSWEMIIGIMGILKAGGAYLPINPNYPQNRIVSMLNDSGAAILLSKEEFIRPFRFISFQYREKFQATPVVTPPRPVITDLDSLQMPDRSLIDYEKYSPYIGQSIVKNSISLHFSRGCKFNCAFCFKVWPTFAYHHRSGQNLFEEINMYYKMGIRRFSFVDDLPNFNVKESSKFFQLIIQNGLKVHIYFPNGIRGDILTKDYIDLMVEAGTVSIDVSLETTSRRLQKLINKNLNLERLHENMMYIIEKYPHVLLETQIIHGIPTETEEEARASLDYMKSIKWLHFPYFHILKIFPGTEMARIALENGISMEAIEHSDDLMYYQLPETLPFPKSFSHQLQSEFTSEYFMAKERLLFVLPHQMAISTENETVQRYDSYLPVKIKTFADLLDYAGISREELKGDFLPDNYSSIPNLNEKIRSAFPEKKWQKNSLNILLLDISSYFSYDRHNVVYDVLEPPLGLTYLMTYVQRKFGSKIRGKILKSRVDFDSFDQLKSIVHDFKPGIIGIRTLNFYKNLFHKTVSLLKQWIPDIPIVTGGPYATCSYSAILKDKHVDLVVIGEGELTFSELIEKMLANEGKLPGEEVLKTIPGIAFADEKTKASRQKLSRDILMLDTPGDIVSPGDVPDPGEINMQTPANLAYVMYTSGSTGIPKGVMVDHKNVLNVVNWFGNTHRLGPGTHVLQLTDFTFDPTIEDVFATLLHGAALHLSDKDLVLDSECFRDYVQKRQIHIINFIPTMLKHLLTDGPTLNSLRVVISGGERLTDNLKDRFIEKRYPLYNNYGPTEITVDALVSKCSQEKVTLGRPISNVKAYICSKNNQLLPVGVPGELCISGAGVARGYMNYPEITAEKFIENPFISGGRLYKTGDIAKWLSNGKIEFIGRMDNQVKVRGHRIELAEIENQLLKHHKIKEAIVTTTDKNNPRSHELELAAYIVMNSSLQDDDFNPSELKDYLKSQLPEHMVPYYFVKLKKIPLTFNGKVDMKRLPPPSTGGRTDDRVAPRDRVEEDLAVLWSEVVELEKESICIYDNFFELGGHSLKATVLISRIHKHLNVKVPLTELFRTPTIEALAKYIKNAVQVTFTAITPAERREYYALSSAQKRLYVIQQVNKETTAYNLPGIFVSRKELSRQRLEITFNKLISRHESLRTSFEMRAGQPAQVVRHQVEFEVEYHELGSAAPGTSEEEIVNHFVRPFDLTRAPLLRVSIVKAGDERHIFMVDMHHIIADGVSLNVLINDFMVLYAGGRLSRLRLHYKDFSHWQNQLARSGELKKQEEFWLNQFAGEIPQLNLPKDFKPPSRQSFEGSTYAFEIQNKDTQGIKKMAKKQGATLFMVLLAVYNVLLSKLSGQEDIVVGTGLAGRRHADLEKIIGMFVNTLALRNYPAGKKTFKEFLQEVKTRTLQAFDNQDYLYENLVEKVIPHKDANRNPLFDTVFMMQVMEGGGSTGTPTTEFSGLALEPYTYENKTSMFDLLLSCDEIGEKIALSVFYRTKLYKQSSIEKFFEYFKEIAAKIVENDEILLADIEVSKSLLALDTTVPQYDFAF